MFIDPKNIRKNIVLAPYTWFRVGGPAQTLFSPQDSQELSAFLKKHREPFFVLGAGSNVLIRDGGIPEPVIRLGKGFHQFLVEYDEIEVGAGLPDRIVAERCQDLGLSGLEFLTTIPGAIGGGVVMNAGCYGAEFADRLSSITLMDQYGEIHCLSAKECGFGYRSSSLPPHCIILSARFRCISSDPDRIFRLMQQQVQSRNDSQPLRERTGGSTFANPENHQAWQLIEKAGYRGKVKGGAQVSEKHCNFLINTGEASAADLESLALEIQAEVFKKDDILMRLEIVCHGVSEPFSA
jgi:UDP-N-acetylmuramate dehydrogenase